MKLYRIEYESDFRHVEAATYGDALSLWRGVMMSGFGPDAGWTCDSDPDSVVLVDDDPVIR